MGMTQQPEGVASELHVGGCASDVEDENETFFRGLKHPEGQTRPAPLASREEAEAEGKRRAEVQRQLKAQRRILEQTAEVQKEMKAQQERVAQLAQDRDGALTLRKCLSNTA
jgi:hypothetical protein